MTEAWVATIATLVVWSLVVIGTGHLLVRWSFPKKTRSIIPPDYSSANVEKVLDVEEPPEPDPEAPDDLTPGHNTARCEDQGAICPEPGDAGPGPDATKVMWDAFKKDLGGKGGDGQG